MAGGYIIDPATGQAGVQTASGAFLPLPMSPDQLNAAGLPRPPGMPPAPPAGPDQRLAFNAPQTDVKSWGNDIPALPAPTQQEQVADIRAQLMPAAQQPTEHASRPGGPGWMPTGQGGSAPKPASVDPSELARPGERAPASQGATGPTGADDPVVQQAMIEAMRGGAGGSGPRGMGVTGETRKYQTFENPGGDPEAARAAQEALSASDKYQEQLAMSLDRRQQQAYEATQAEFAARSGQLAAQQRRFEEQQSMLLDYQAKRDAAMQEAAQLKTPQMEDYWQSRGTFANVMTGLSIALGGALQGLRGGQNPGLEMSNQSIDRWVASQREEYQRAMERGRELDNQYGRMVQLFGSENLAAEHLREQAWTVRDGMLKSYAEKIGTPSALENYNQAMLETEAKRAAMRAQNSQGAMVDIEQKLSMQGGGGGGKPKGVLDMLRAGAEAKKLKSEIEGDGKESEREVSPEKVKLINSALSTVESSDDVVRLLGDLDATESDYDDPLSGPVDYVQNLAGGKRRERSQRLEQATQILARNLQASRNMGNSDDDREQADKIAGMGKSGQERRMAAAGERAAALGALQTTLASLTPQQQRDLIRQLRAKSPERAAQVEAAIGATGRAAPAPTERPF